MFISIEDAKKNALHYLNTELSPKLEIALLEDKIVSFRGGFIIHYNSKKYIVENKSGYKIAGLAPLIVDKLTGEIYHPCVKTDPTNFELVQLFRKNRKKLLNILKALNSEI